MLTAEQLVRRLLWLIPPAKFHLTSFHGLLSSHAAARAAVLPRPTAPAQPPAATGAPAVKTKKRPRLDWATLHARTWGVDVWLCPCGGKRNVTALVTSRHTAEEILRNLGLLPAAPPRPAALAQAPPQLDLSLG